MKFKIAVLSILFLFGICCCQTPADSLWLKAGVIASANENWLPGIVNSTVQEMDKHGNVKKVVQETVIRLYLDENGEVAEEILKLIDEGEDKTEEARQKSLEEEAVEKDSEEGEQSQTFSFSVGKETMFNPANRDSVEFTRLDTTTMVEGRKCAVYRTKRILAEGTVVNGEAFLDLETGAPLLLKSSPDPLPKFMKKMENVVFFQYHEDGSWYIAKMTTRAEGGFLFIKKRFLITIELSDYWIREDD